MLTLNQHIKIFRDFATAHSQINSFSNAKPEMLVNTEHGLANERLKYPILFVEIGGVTINENSLLRTYTCYVADRMSEGSVDEQQILSDTQQSCFDLFSYFKNAFPDFKVSLQRTTSMTDLVRAFDDTLAGWTIGITLSEAFQYDSCNVPYTSTPPVIDGACPKVTIYESNGITVNQLVSAGGFFVLPVSGPCAAATVKNSDNTFTQSIASGAIYTLADQSVEPFINAVSQGVTTYPAMTNPVINLIWT